MSNVCICVDLAVNNDAGNFSGELEAVAIGDVAQLDGDTLVVELQSHALTIEEARFPFRRWIEWHGNMAWNGYEMTIADAARLLETLRRKHWTITEAESRLFAAYDSGMPLENVLTLVLSDA